MKILLSAYACEPGKGSEPGVGWNMARYMARHCEIWVLTRANNRPAIESELARKPVPGLYFVYHDLPAWARFWKREQRGVQLYYYLWQLTAIPLVKRLHRKVGFDLVHHVTFVKYWAPSVLAFLEEVPFVWGPVGGGESAPLAFWTTFGLGGVMYEITRTAARLLGELDPLVRFTAQRTSLALATTPETMARLKRLGVKHVEVMSEIALPDEDVEILFRIPSPAASPIRFLSIGRLLHLKGFHLGVEAFARSGLKDAEYWLLGEGPERRRLEALAQRLGVAGSVRFLGQLPRREVLRLLSQCHVLVHPSLHDSGGWVCLEAMAAGRPVICLDLGGPAVQVTEETGFKISASSPQQVIDSIAEVMRVLAFNWPQQIIVKGRKRVAELFSWPRRAEQISDIYMKVLKNGR
ncbi:MAG: glycosyltransferase [Candidatus Methanomethylicaceae archaeon]